MVDAAMGSVEVSTSVHVAHRGASQLKENLPKRGLWGSNGDLPDRDLSRLVIHHGLVAQVWNFGALF